MVKKIVISLLSLLCCGLAVAQEGYWHTDPKDFLTDEEPGEYPDKGYAVINISSAHHATYYNSSRPYEMPYGCYGIVYYIQETDDEYGGKNYYWERGEAYDPHEQVPEGQALVIYSNIVSKMKLFYDWGTPAKSYPGVIELSNLYGTDDEVMISETSPNITDDYYYYGLSYGDNGGKLGFYWRNDDGAPFINGAHRAYLRALKSKVKNMDNNQSAKSGFSFEDLVSTDIERLLAGETMSDLNKNDSPIIYDLTGRLLNQKPSKGVYIRNGKKYIVR